MSRKEENPDKGKPPEKMGRKTTGLTPLTKGGKVAGSPGVSSSSQKMHVVRG